MMDNNSLSDVAYQLNDSDDDDDDEKNTCENGNTIFYINNKYGFYS